MGPRQFPIETDEFETDRARPGGLSRTEGLIRLRVDLSPLTLGCRTHLSVHVSGVEQRQNVLGWPPNSGLLAANQDRPFDQDRRRRHRIKNRAIV